MVKPHSHVAEFGFESIHFYQQRILMRELLDIRYTDILFCKAKVKKLAKTMPQNSSSSFGS